MKIAIIGTRGIPSRYSGIEAGVEECARRLALRGHEVVVYCRHKPEVRRQGIPSNINLIYIPTINTKHLGTFVHSLLSTLHMVFSDADIAHFHALGPSVFALLPRIAGKKSVVTVHGLDWERKKWGFFARVFLRMCEYPAVFFPDRTIAVSLALKNYFEGKFKKNIDYVPNGITPLPAGAPGLSAEKGYILFVGRLVPEKGIHHLIKAFNELHTSKKLLIAGEPSFTAGYSRYLRAIADERTCFLGFVQRDHLRGLYENAGVFVLPSEVEGSPVSLLEAMSLGKCVLVSDIPGSAEVACGCGFVFRSGDYLDLKAKLQYLIDNPGALDKAGQKAREHVEASYDWDKIIDSLEKLYLAL